MAAMRTQRLRYQRIVGRPATEVPAVAVASQERWAPGTGQDEPPRRFAVLVLLRAGVVRLSVRGASAEHGPGTAILLVPRGDVAMRAIGLTEVQIVRFFDLRSPSPHDGLLREAPGAWAVDARFVDGMEELFAVAIQQPTDRVFLGGLLDLMLYRLARAASAGRGVARDESDTEWRRVLPEIETIERIPVSVAALARRCGVSVERLRDLTRRHAGCGPRAYVVGRVMARAAWLLASTRRPIAAIAVELGFTDPYHFSRAFRRWAKVSPLGYRRRGGA